VLAFILAAVGLYGVISYSTAQRRREIGIRIAVGGQPRRVLLTMLREGFVMAGCGVVSGIVIAALIARLAGDFLVGVSAFDPLTYFSISILLAAVALLASAIPAQRATRVDPAIVLRQEQGLEIWLQRNARGKGAAAKIRGENHFGQEPVGDRFY
jgi:putative ABC transport system permease protein